MNIPLKYSQDFYVNRLVTEWLAHEKIIVACDIDDTLLPYNESQVKQCEETVRVLKDAAVEGILLICNTAREEAKHAGTMLAIRELGLNPTCVNKMPENWELSIGLSGKIYANIYLDDRGGLVQALNHLSTATQKVKEIREQIKLKTEL
jgi:predicted mannosyl-3-phosphoglycerate phosphatase (HAD superfamily)